MVCAMVHKYPPALPGCKSLSSTYVRFLAVNCHLPHDHEQAQAYQHYTLICASATLRKSIWKLYITKSLHPTSNQAIISRSLWKSPSFYFWPINVKYWRLINQSKPPTNQHNQRMNSHQFNQTNNHKWQLIDYWAHWAECKSHSTAFIAQ
jgi:hypothetical protein